MQDQRREDSSWLGWICYRTWYPFKTMRSVLVLSFLFALLFLGLAILQFALYAGTQEHEVIYANHQGCIERTNGKNCETIINIEKDMSPPIAVVYVIQNAYVNHRRYIDSVIPEQLAGKTIDLKTAEAKCKPFVTNADMNETVSYTGALLNPDFVASPCGFTAKLAFNDTFQLSSQAGKQIAINQSGLFPNIYGQFKRGSDSESTQWIDPEDEHFMIWMQNSGSITKYKLWGRIEDPLPAGQYNLVAENNFQIGELKIKKGLMLVNPSAIGSAVYFFPIVYVLMGLACLVFAIFLKLKMPDYDALLKEVEGMDK